MNALPTYPHLLAHWLLLAIPGAYLLGFVLQLLPLGSNPRLRSGLALLCSLAPLAFSLSLFFVPHQGSTGFSFPWVRIGDVFQLNMGVYLDDLGGFMLLMLNLVVFLVFLFSAEYMRKDPQLGRYWAFLSLFAFSMTGIVLADNLFMIFIFWELVGFSSYLLIGFWHHKPAASRASQKAFLLNRIGDLGFVLALLLLWDPNTLLKIDLTYPEPASTVVGLCLVLAALGKSAQFPLQVWLPDAMTGPTPVSSLLHAATMVAAGVFLLLRTARYFNETVLLVLAVVGALTALLAALSAVQQTDLKRILAYSTVSQLGFMVLGVGTGVFAYAGFHLLTHAFFKCGLFLVAGASIHLLHQAQHRSGTHFDVQDLRHLGGLRNRFLQVVFVVYAAALMGLPFTGGFLSKDGILLGAWHFGEMEGGLAWLVPVAGIAAAVLTAYYITRLGLLLFGGPTRMDAETHAAIPRLNWKMAVPLGVLAFFSLWLPFTFGGPFERGIVSFLETPYPGSPVDHHGALLPWMLVGLSLLAAAGAWWRWKNGKMLPEQVSGWQSVLKNHFGLDQLYEQRVAPAVLRFASWMGWSDRRIVDGAVNGLAASVVREEDQWSLSRLTDWWDRQVVDRLVGGVARVAMALGKGFSRLQPGDLQRYLIYTLLGLLALLAGIYYFVGP